MELQKILLKLVLTQDRFSEWEWNSRWPVQDLFIARRRNTPNMSNFTPISAGQLVANSQGQLFLQADPSTGVAAADVTALIKQLTEEYRKAVQAAAQQDDLLKAEQAAKLLNCSLATLHRWTASGAIPSIKIKNSRRYPRSKLLALADANASPSKNKSKHQR